MAELKPRHSRDNGITRRRAIGSGGALVTTWAISGCGLFDTESDSRGGGSDTPADGSLEAPQLADQVASGDLPPLEERLPGVPAVLEPPEGIGVYGGEWNLAFTGPGDEATLDRTIGHEGLVKFRPDTTSFALDDIEPNVAERFEVGGDGREYTFHLREGLKWSDGEPFTADDILFWYEDVLLNEELTPALPQTYQADGPVEVEEIDEFTIVFRFSEPKGLFLWDLAQRPGLHPHRYPKHYLSQFHPSHNANVDELVRQEGFSDWIELFGQKAEHWFNPECPVLYSWTLSAAIGDVTGDRLIAERNPYYWKTDPEGRQLPYIDRVVFSMVSDAEAMVLRAANGQIDMQDTHFTTATNKPVLANSRDDGGFEFFDLASAANNTMNLIINLTHKDPVKREIFQNKDFRIGLSHAINRDDIISAVYASQGEPHQSAPRPESALYDEEFAKQYTEHDPDLATEHLDRVLPDKDGDGRRLDPAGEPFRFSVLVTDVGVGAEWPDVMELIQQDLADVGVTVDVDRPARGLWRERMTANDFDATTWGGFGVAVVARPQRFMARDTFSFHGVAWANWYLNGGTRGTVETTPGQVEEPPEPAREQMELYDQLLQTADPKRQQDLMREILQIAKQEFWSIGISLPVGGYGIVRNNFHNVPDGYMNAGFAMMKSRAGGAIFYIDNQ